MIDNKINSIINNLRKMGFEEVRFTEYASDFKDTHFTDHVAALYKTRSFNRRLITEPGEPLFRQPSIFLQVDINELVRGISVRIKIGDVVSLTDYTPLHNFPDTYSDIADFIRRRCDVLITDFKNHVLKKLESL